MSNDAESVARRWFEEVWNQRRGETIAELLTEASVCHAEDGDIRGPEEFRERVFVPMLAAFPDLALTIEGTLAQGDQVAIRWSLRARHTGEGLGCLPTQRPITMHGLTWIRVTGGKLIEGWQHSDIPAVVRSLSEPM